MKAFLPLLGASLIVSPPLLQATPFYWDINGTTPGAGGSTPTGAWSTGEANWNSAADGGAGGTISGWVNGNTAIFAAGSDATGSYSATPDATVTSFESLTWKDGGTGAVLTIQPSSALAINNLSGIITVSGSADTRLAFNAVLSGTQGLTKMGAGILQLNSRVANYTGDTFVAEGTLRLAAAGRVPGTTNIDITAGAAVDLRGNNGTTTIAGLSGGGVLYNGASNTATTLQLNSDSGTRTFSGEIAHTGTGVIHLDKSGSFTQVLSGSDANTVLGNVTVNGGVLALAKTSGVNAIAPDVAVTVNGGTLRLDASEQIADSAKLTLAGGTLSLNGSESETFSTALALEDDSIIDFGSGVASLSFGDSSGEGWGSSIIIITGFNIGTDFLRFGTSDSGLTIDQLALFRFADYGNATATIDTEGYITPIPEPGSLALLLGSGLIALRLRKNRKGRE